MFNNYFCSLYENIYHQYSSPYGSLMKGHIFIIANIFADFSGWWNILNLLWLLLNVTGNAQFQMCKRYVKMAAKVGCIIFYPKLTAHFTAHEKGVENDLFSFFTYPKLEFTCQIVRFRERFNSTWPFLVWHSKQNKEGHKPFRN